MFELVSIYIECDCEIKDLKEILCYNYKIYPYDNHIVSITTFMDSNYFKYLREIFDNHKEFNLIFQDIENKDYSVIFNKCKFIRVDYTFKSDFGVEVSFISECEDYIESF